MKNVALFGGAFDPPHIGHVATIRAALCTAGISEVWIVPSSDTRYDKKLYAGATHRLAMARLMVQECFSGEPVSVIALEAQGLLKDSATIELVDFLKSQHQDTSFSIIIGSDNLEGVEKWREWKRLQEEATLFVMPRGGENVKDLEQSPEVLRLKAKLLAAPSTVSLSSSDLRKMISSCTSIGGLVPAIVFHYINENGLYATISTH